MKYEQKFDDAKKAVERKTGNASKSETIVKAPVPLIEFISAADWEGQPIPSLRWVVHQRILRSSVAILNGDGAIGKTTIALQLAVAVSRWTASRQTDWLSAVVDEGGPVLFFSAEEIADEIQRRLAMILDYYGLSFRDIPDLHWHCRPGEDALLCTFGRSGIIEPRPLFDQLTTEARDRKAALVIVEAAADVFGGDERNRAQVRQFMRLLRQPAIKSGAAVLLLQHPSLTGMSTGTGTSGSTDWNNAARPRLYFSKASEGGERDSGLRKLEIMKTNYGPPGEVVQVRWERGVFVPLTSPASFERAAAEADIDAAYLACLDAYHARRLHVGAEPGRAYAPAKFEDMPQAKGYKKAALAKAQERLFNSGRIEVKQIGPCPSKMLARIVRKEG
jgi:RecA-family ATPase